MSCKYEFVGTVNPNGMKKGGDTLKEIIDRRSIRKYKEKLVEKTDIETILRAGMYAPSAKNRQPWRYYVYSGEKKNVLLDVMEKGLVRERDGKKRLPNSQNGLPDAFHTLKIMREAPVLIIIEKTNGFVWPQKYGMHLQKVFFTA